MAPLRRPAGLLQLNFHPWVKPAITPLAATCSTSQSPLCAKTKKDCVDARQFRRSANALLSWTPRFLRERQRPGTLKRNQVYLCCWKSSDRSRNEVTSKRDDRFFRCETVCFCSNPYSRDGERVRQRSRGDLLHNRRQTKFEPSFQQSVGERLPEDARGMLLRRKVRRKKTSFGRFSFSVAVLRVRHFLPAFSGQSSGEPCAQRNMRANVKEKF